MKEIELKKAVLLLAKAIERVTVNTYVEQGSAGTDEVFTILEQVEKICGKGGEWVQLPCKVGDILYVISQMKDKRILPFINEYEVTSISIKRKSIVIYHEMDGYIKSFKQTDFGKTVFLTKEEAERAVTDINVGSK